MSLLQIHVETLMDQAYELGPESSLEVCEGCLAALKLVKSQVDYLQLPEIQQYRHQCAIVLVLCLMRTFIRAELLSFTTSSQDWIARNNAAIMMKQTTLLSMTNGIYAGPLDCATVISDIAWLSDKNERFVAQRRERQMALMRIENEGLTADLEVQQRWER